MKRIAVAIIVSGFAYAGAADGFNTSWGSGWRVSVGGAMNGNMRTKAGLRADGAWRRAIPARAAVPSGASRAEAQAAGDAYDSIGSGRVAFPGGGFIDPESSRTEPGTWNWYWNALMPSPSITPSLLTSLQSNTSCMISPLGYTFSVTISVSFWNG